MDGEIASVGAEIAGGGEGAWSVWRKGVKEMAACPRRQPTCNITILATVEWGRDRPARPSADIGEPGVGDGHDLLRNVGIDRYWTIIQGESIQHHGRRNPSALHGDTETAKIIA